MSSILGTENSYSESDKMEAAVSLSQAHLEGRFQVDPQYDNNLKGLYIMCICKIRVKVPVKHCAPQ